MAKVNNSQKNNKNLKDTQIEQWASGMTFNKWNYILLCISILVLILGYVLLSGGGTDDPNQFSEAIFDTRRLIVAPITLVIGFAIAFFAIMLRFGKKEEESDNSIAPKE